MQALSHSLHCLQGLWRVTGQQVEAAAVAGEGGPASFPSLPSMHMTK